jgi:hypothetical protein
MMKANEADPVTYRLFHAQKDAKRASNHAAKGNVEKANQSLYWVRFHIQKAMEAHEQSRREG